MKENSHHVTMSPRHRKNILLVFFILCSFLLFTGCAKKEIKNIDAKGTRIICFGDSITFGYGAGPGEDYPTALAKLTPIPVINAGVSGDTSTQALKRLKEQVLDKDPFLVIVEFCGNDFIKKVPLEVTVSNINYMIDSIQAQGAMVALMDISAGMFMKDYRVAFSKIAQEKQAIFISGMLRGIITNPPMKSDFLHPNVNGYRLIAQRVYRIIKPYIDAHASPRGAVPKPTQ